MSEVARTPSQIKTEYAILDAVIVTFVKLATHDQRAGGKAYIVVQYIMDAYIYIHTYIHV